MILIALGGNLQSRAGRPAQTLDAALDYLQESGIRVAALSPYYVTPAWPDPADPPYVNAVANIETGLTPAAVMQRLHRTETAFGRIRSVRNAPRTLDLDLLAYDARVEEGPPVLPHPRIAERAFVLVPLADIAPDWRHPITGWTARAMRDALPQAERDAVRPISPA